MFEDFARRSDRIVVTGPPRSGTTICSQMIASDINYQYVDEHDFSLLDPVRLREVLSRTRVVVQCPLMLKLLVDEPPPGVLIVLMRRDVADIERSEARIRQQMAFIGPSTDESAAARYAYWDANPPSNSIEIEYETLSGHWAFVERSLRADFRPKQTALSGPLWISDNSPIGPALSRPGWRPLSGICSVKPIQRP